MLRIKKNATCPVTNQALKLEDLRPNYQLRHAIQNWVKYKKKEIE